MATIDSLVVKLLLDAKEFNTGKEATKKGLKEASEEANRTGKALKKVGEDGGKGFDSVARAAAKFLAVIGGAYAIKTFIQNTIESNAALDRFSKNLGAATRTVSAWSNAAEIAGGSAGGLQGTMDMLSKAQTQLQLTGESSLIPYFSQLGISMADAYGRARPVNDVLLDLADRFGQMDRRTAVNMGEMMGIDPGTMNLLIQGRRAVEDMIARQKEYNAISKEQAAEATRLREKIIKSRQSFEAMGRKLLSDVTPALEWLLSKLQAIGDWISQNRDFVETFLTVLATGLAAVGLAAIPINLTVAAILALAAGIATLWNDYQVWKSGGESLIDWGKWEPGITAAKNAMMELRDKFLDFIGTFSERFPHLSALIKDFGSAIKIFAGMLLDDVIEVMKILWEWLGKIAEKIEWAANKVLGVVDTISGKLGNNWFTRKAGEMKSSTEQFWKEHGSKLNLFGGGSESSGSPGASSSALGDLIARGEGDYNSVNRGAAGGYKAGTENLENMTVAEVMEAQKSGKFNAAGRYQIIKGTLSDAVKGLGLKGNEKFDKATQDRIFNEYLIGMKRREIGDYVSGKSDDVVAAAKAASMEWASVASPETEKSYYAGVGNNKASISSSEMIAALKQAREQRQSQYASAAPVAGAAQFSEGAGAGQAAAGRSAGQSMTAQTDNHSVETNIGSITINTQATDAAQMGRDLRNENWLFPAQANTGLT